MPASVIVPLTKKPRTVKESLISFLSQEWPLSTKKLYNKVRKSGLDVTYQAIHKAVQELLSDGVICRENHDYSLDRDWIDSVKSFADGLGCVYQGGSETIKKAIEKGYGSYTFDKVHRFYVELTKMLKAISAESGTTNDIGAAQFRHMYWGLASSQKVTRW